MRDKKEQTDGQLLTSYLTSGQEADFEELVKRHSSMVLGVCRRVLINDQQEAEDVFQAVFALLLKHAVKLQKSDGVGGWLYRVAWNGALKAKQKAAKRREHEKQAGEMRMVMNAEDSKQNWGNLQPVLDEELNRLPEKLRTPLVLCYLEKKTEAAAIELLGWTSGQVKGRLAKGKKLLHKRLMRRGVALSSAALFGLIAENVSASVVPDALCAAAVKVSIGFASGQAASAGAAAVNVSVIMKGMETMLLWTKIKLAMVYLTVFPVF